MPSDEILNYPCSRVWNSCIQDGPQISKKLKNSNPGIDTDEDHCGIQFKVDRGES
jgi:hypothetical protein